VFAAHFHAHRRHQAVSVIVVTVSATVIAVIIVLCHAHAHVNTASTTARYVRVPRYTQPTVHVEPAQLRHTFTTPKLRTARRRRRTASWPARLLAFASAAVASQTSSTAPWTAAAGSAPDWRPSDASVIAFVLASVTWLRAAARRAAARCCAAGFTRSARAAGGESKRCH